MVLVVIDGNQCVFCSFGEICLGNNQYLQFDLVICIVFFSKLMISEMLVKLFDQGVVKFNDLLSKYVLLGVWVFDWQGKLIILVNFVIYISVLLCEQSGGVVYCLVFVWLICQQCWNWFFIVILKVVLGLQVVYFNLVFDLLVDVFVIVVGKLYLQLFEEQIIWLLGMKDIIFILLLDQCQWLMILEKGVSLCNNILVVIGSGGVYLMLGDMMCWMQQFLLFDFYICSQQVDWMQMLIYQCNQLIWVIGMDVLGCVDVLGFGWVYMKLKNGYLGIIQKIGGGGGFIIYMVMNLQVNVGVFVVVICLLLICFNNMSDGINDLVSELSGVQFNMQMVSQ